MENQLLLEDSGQDPRRAAKASLVPLRRQYREAPFAEAMEQPGPGLLTEYLQMLQRRKGTLAVVVSLAVVISLLYTLPQTPVYQARASIEVQNLNQNFLNMHNLNPTEDDGGPGAAGSELQTLAKIFQSESLLQRVAGKLDLGKRLSSAQGRDRYSGWRKALGLNDPKPISSREAILDLVTSNLKISTDANTRLIEIRYDSTDPQLAADFVNTLTTEFVQQNLESHWKTTQQTGEWLTHQMEDVRVKLEKSENELQTFAQTSGLEFTSEKDNVAEDKLRELQEELSKAQADRIAIQSRYELASTASPETLPEVLDDGTLKDYQAKLAELRRQMAEMSSSLTPAHYQVKKVQAEITTLEQDRDKERTDVIQRTKNEFISAQRREQLLAANYASQASLMSEQAAKVTHYNILKLQVDSNRQLYDSMLQNVQQAGVASALGASNIRVVDSAQAPTRPYRPNVALNSTLGLLVGAFFGIALIVVQDRANRTIQGPGDITMYLDVPELGAIPSANVGKNRLLAYYQNGKALGSKNLENGKPSQVELVTSNKKPSLLADSFRATLTSILFTGENGDRPRVIVITSANPGEGKTTVASNLALGLAEIGQSVLLIDGDLRRPRLHDIFGVPNRWGLADVLDGKAPPAGCEAMFFKTGFRNLSVLPAGSSVANTTALLHSPAALRFLNIMRAEFQTIIIDTPPMLHMSDARIFGRCADGVILVVRSAQTMRDAAVAANQRLAEDGTRVLGTILNQWDPRETKNYGYGYSQKYY